VSIAQPVTLPNFVAPRQEVCEISAVENLASLEVDQSSPKSLMTCYAPKPLTVPNSSHSVKWCTRNALQFLHPLVFWRHRGTPYAKVHRSGWYVGL